MRRVYVWEAGGMTNVSIFRCRQEICSKCSTLIYIIFIYLIYVLLPSYVKRIPHYVARVKIGNGGTIGVDVLDYVPNNYKLTVVFLHSDMTDVHIWQEIETLQFLKRNGYRGTALGMKFKLTSTDEFDKAIILQNTLLEIRAQRMVLVVPSSSGSYGLLVVIRGSLKLKGFVAIAPSNTDHFSQLEYKNLNTSTLIIYGDSDTQGLSAARNLLHIPNSRVEVMRGTSHLCYIQRPQEFHQILLSFLKPLFEKE